MLQSDPNNNRPLILQVSKGDEFAFHILFDQYRDRVFSIAWRITGVRSAAEDVVQEVFIKLWINREKLPEVENFNAYLNTVIRNHIFNNLRRIAYEQTFLEELIKQGSLNTHDFSDPVLYNELQNLVHKAIKQLLPQQKRVFQLSRVDGLTHAQIASTLNISRSTVKGHMVTALRSIKSFLSAYEGLISTLMIICTPHVEYIFQKKIFLFIPVLSPGSCV